MKAESTNTITFGNTVRWAISHSLSDILRNLSVILSSAVHDKDVEILFNVSGGIPSDLMGDGLRLQQVLLNLAGNAIKFTMHGEVIITVDVQDATPEQVTLEFAVKDSGIGIVPEMLEHVFDGFTQAEASTTRRFGGTGLGLSISRQLVGLMGGVLAAESEPDKGSTFHFTATFGRGLESSSKSMHLNSVSNAFPHDRQIFALIVDDNAVAREVLSTMAESLGWHVESASSGHDALELITAKASNNSLYDVVLLDWKMPGMDGLETAQQIRLLPDTVRAPVIIMVTAHGREYLAEHLSEESSPLDAFLVKPVTPSMLYDAVIDVTSGRSKMANIPSHTASQLRRISGMRLLIVEDNQINQQVAQEILMQEGASVAVASSGQEGIDLLSQEEPFDAVLMDIQMPGMDGYETTRNIRNTLGLKELPIIAMTANALPADRELCLEAGMNDHIGKPIDADRLVEVLYRNCGIAGGEAVSQDSPATRHSLDRPGFDFDAALKRLNNKSLYARMARSFEMDQAGVRHVRMSLNQGDLESALHELHTLKGLAATMGATALSRIAADMETALKNNRSHEETEKLLHELELLFSEACQVLQKVADDLDPPPEQNAERAGFERNTLITSLIDLEPLLLAGNMKAMQSYQKFREQLRTALGDKFLPLDEAMQRLDFPDAAVLCQNMRKYLQ